MCYAPCNFKLQKIRDQCIKTFRWIRLMQYVMYTGFAMERKVRQYCADAIYGEHCKFIGIEIYIRKHNLCGTLLRIKKSR